MNAARLLVSTLRERQLADRDGYLVERVHLALEGAEELLTDLLDISKLDQNAVRPDISDFPLLTLLEPLASELQSVAENEGLRLRLRPSRLSIRSDSRLLTRILRNLLSNALRYTREGGVLLGVRRRGDRLSIQVWDSGDGIEPDKLEEIFREFHQLPDHHPGSAVASAWGWRSSTGSPGCWSTPSRCARRREGAPCSRSRCRWRPARRNRTRRI
ncbi:sensor histidine kinase [Marinobacterium aestuariivivens]|uniref:histidine kinase n=1 Tax=Marinobacterium aestuariivivens TaxID=1698799 RepID=A0ABW2A4H7_9GAMM